MIKFFNKNKEREMSLTDEVRALNDGFSKAVSNQDVDMLVEVLRLQCEGACAWSSDAWRAQRRSRGSSR